MKMECFVVYRNEIERRLDPYFYRSSFRNTEEKLKNINVKKLSEISKRIKKGIFYILAEEYVDSGVPFIRVSNLKDGTITKDNLVCITEYMNLKHKRTEFHPGDILISKTGNLAVSVIPDDIPKCNISQDIIGIELKEGYNSKYVAIFLNSEFGIYQLSRILQGQVQSHLTVSSVREIKIPILSHNKQDKIVQIMENAFKLKREKEAEAKQLLDSINDYILSELGIKLPELRDRMTFVVYADNVKSKRMDPYYYQPKFGEIEKAIENGKFDLVKIKDVLEINNKLENIYNYQKIRYIDLASIDKNLGIVKKYKIIDSSDAPSRARQKVTKGDLLLASLSGSLKSIAIVNKEDNNMIASTGFYIVKNKEEYDNYYLWALFRSYIYQILLSKETTGAIMSAINRNALLNLKIPFPPLNVQDKISNVVEKRLERAKQLQKEAKEILEKAKQKVENIILNGETNES